MVFILVITFHHLFHLRSSLTRSGDHLPRGTPQLRRHMSASFHRHRFGTFHFSSPIFVFISSQDLPLQIDQLGVFVVLLSNHPFVDLSRALQISARIKLDGVIKPLSARAVVERRRNGSVVILFVAVVGRIRHVARRSLNIFFFFFFSLSKGGPKQKSLYKWVFCLRSVKNIPKNIKKKCRRNGKGNFFSDDSTRLASRRRVRFLPLYSVSRRMRPLDDASAR